MNYPAMRIAVLPGDGTASPQEEAHLVSGDVQTWLPSWLRARLQPGRSEPLAVCLSVRGDLRDLDHLLHDVEASFRSGGRYSVTTSLSKALLACHDTLAEENGLSLPEHRHYAAGVIAAVRPNGLYLARTGPTLVLALQRGRITSRSNDPLGRSPQNVTELGTSLMPHVATEQYMLEPGDVVLVVPGAAAFEASEREIRGALEGLPHLVLAEALLDACPRQTSIVAIWRPTSEDEDAETYDPRWSVWTEAPRAAQPQRDERPPVEVEPEPLRNTGLFAPVAAAERPESAPTPRRSPRVTPTLAYLGQMIRQFGLTGILTLGLLALVAIIVVVIVRTALPGPGGTGGTLTDAGRIIQEARANPDREVAATLLDEAKSMLEPLIPTSEGARALSVEAQSAQDRILDVVRIPRPGRVALQTAPDFRPAGLWKTDTHLLMLDFGGQALYRLNLQSEVLEPSLRPGDVIDGQQVGRLVTGAWSPPRGSNVEGRLLLVDQNRSFISVQQNGSADRRWFPPDNPEWQRLGSAAASFDDLFILDTSREEIRRYPARLAGAVGTVVARSSDQVSLSNVMDLATDGNLYVLQSDGGILKLAPGAARLPFDGTVPYRPLQAPAALFAHPDIDHLWVLEPMASRVVEFTNQGTYVRQFVLPPDLIRPAVAIHVDAQAQVLRMLTPQSVLQVPLQ